MRNINQTLMTGRRLASAILIVLTGGMALLSSCTYEEEDLFDQSAAQRLNASVKDYRELLTSSQYGWVMEYWPNNGTMGGYVFTAKFSENGDVEMCGEEDITYDGKTYTPGDAFTSNYSVKSEQGTILTFDTYNPLFHRFSEPQGSSNVSGYNSDYEFVFLRASENQDTIVLRGKKYGQEMTMTRLEESAGKYMEEVRITRDICEILNLNTMSIGGITYPISINNRIFTIYDVNNDNQKITSKVWYKRFAINLFDEIVLNGDTLKTLSLSNDYKKIISPNGAFIEIPSLEDQLIHAKYPWLFQIAMKIDDTRAHYVVLEDRVEMSDRLYKCFRQVYSGYDPDNDVNMQVFLDISITSDKGFFATSLKNYEENSHDAIGYEIVEVGSTPNTTMILPIFSRHPVIRIEFLSYFLFITTFGYNYRFSLDFLTDDTIALMGLGFTDVPKQNFARLDFDENEYILSRIGQDGCGDVRPFLNTIFDNSPYHIECDNQQCAKKIKFTSMKDSDIWFNLALNYVINL